MFVVAGAASLPSASHESLKGNREEIPKSVKVVIEVPKGSILKRRPNGSIDFMMPCPCPFNYGSVMSSSAMDGDPLDAIVLGSCLPYGHIGTHKVKGKLKFMDAGIVDDKLVCVQPSHQSDSFFDSSMQTDLCNAFGFPTTHQSQSFLEEDLGIIDWLSLSLIFAAYVPFKTWLNAMRKKHGLTSFNGWEFYD